MKTIAPPPSRRLSIRDVADVEAYVSDTLARLPSGTGSGGDDRLVRAGISAVVRVERAMPPELPLAPVLDSLLPQRLLALLEEAPVERAPGRLRDAA